VTAAASGVVLDRDLQPYDEDIEAPTRQLLQVAIKASGQSVGGMRSACQEFRCCKAELLQAAIALGELGFRDQR
jgi:hypothetical protein